ncbi:hypothetical protein HZC21_02045 [Candidatus Peregrinibacteria bacterium]|nr:hypothetical protein [Candidatus Peregrinibacteria bacterium]
MELLTINDAAQLSGKSIQTMRRMIKQKKVQIKKQKTPQGFNYLIIKDSLLNYMAHASQMATQQAPSIQGYTREHQSITQDYTEQFKAEIDQFNMTIQKLIEHSSKDKENFFRLIGTFQDRVSVLENQIKLLESPKPSWWKFWK